MDWFSQELAGFEKVRRGSGDHLLPGSRDLAILILKLQLELIPFINVIPPVPDSVCVGK